MHLEPFCETMSERTGVCRGPRLHPRHGQSAAGFRPRLPQSEMRRAPAVLGHAPPRRAAAQLCSQPLLHCSDSLGPTEPAQGARWMHRQCRGTATAIYTVRQGDRQNETTLFILLPGSLRSSTESSMHSCETMYRVYCTRSIAIYRCHPRLASDITWPHLLDPSLSGGAMWKVSGVCSSLSKALRSASRQSSTKRRNRAQRAHCTVRAQQVNCEALPAVLRPKGKGRSSPACAAVHAKASAGHRGILCVAHWLQIEPM